LKFIILKIESQEEKNYYMEKMSAKWVIELFSPIESLGYFFASF